MDEKLPIEEGPIVLHSGDTDAIESPGRWVWVQYEGQEMVRKRYIDIPAEELGLAAPHRDVVDRARYRSAFESVDDSPGEVDMAFAAAVGVQDEGEQDVEQGIAVAAKRIAWDILEVVADPDQQVKASQASDG